jgi:hypothetical protein
MDNTDFNQLFTKMDNKSFDDNTDVNASFELMKNIRQRPIDLILEEREHLPPNENALALWYIGQIIRYYLGSFFQLFRR